MSKVIAKNEGDYVLGGGAGSDVVAVAHEVNEAGAEEIHTSTVKVFDMASGAAPVALDLNASQETHGFVGAVAGSTLLVSDQPRQTLKLIDISGGQPTVRTVGDSYFEPTWMRDTLSDTAVARNHDRDLVIDLKTGQQVGTYQPAPEPDWPKPYVPRSSFLSPTHVGWTERTDDKLVLATAVRGQDEVVRTPLGPDDSTTITGGLLGDWFLWGATTGNATPWHAFWARSLKDGSTVKLLDHATNAVKGPDGTFLVLGTTAADGAGVYRVAVGADGKPAASLIASTGEPNDGATPLAYVGGAPVTVDLDGVAKTRLSWKFSTTRADLTVELRRKGSWETFETVVRPASGSGAHPDGSLGFDWAGEVEKWRPRPAPNGTYEWTVTARPWNGMPSVTTSGTLTVTRSPKAHDFDDDGAPDLVARDSPCSSSGPSPPRVRGSTGWSSVPRTAKPAAPADRHHRRAEPRRQPGHIRRCRTSAAVVSLDRATRARLEWTFSSSEADFSVMVRRKWGPGFGATVKAGVDPTARASTRATGSVSTGPGRC
ncbi:hypothetical protein STANM309S_06144 [Streptomyces tanashiensis]